MPRSSCLTVLMLLAGTALSAQEPSIGIGITMNPAGLLAIDDNNGLFTIPTGLSNILVPIRLGKVMLEPEIGMFKLSTTTTTSGFPGSGTSTTSSTNLRLAVGLLFNLPRKGNLQAYVGPRIGMIRTTSSSSGSGSGPDPDPVTSIVLTGAIGAHYFFSPHFSLGGEAQVSYVKLGDNSGSGSGFEQHSHIFGTSAVAVIRFFL